MKRFTISAIFTLFAVAVLGQSITFEGKITGTNELITLEKVVVTNLSTNATKDITQADNFTIPVVTSSGVENLNIENNIGLQKVYPNPFNSVLNIEFYASGKGQTQISVFDNSGKIVSSYVGNLQQGVHKCEFTPKNQGLYFVKLTDNGKTYSSKAISAIVGNPYSRLVYVEQISNKEINYTKGGSDELVITVGDKISFVAYYDSKTVTIEITASGEDLTVTFIFEKKTVILVSGITVNGSDINTDGGTSQMNVDVLPADATVKTITWSLENNTIGATISASGLLIATGETAGNGTVTVKASATDASGFSATKVITISGQVTPVTSIAVSGASSATNISTDGGTLQMYADVSPATATDKTVTWSVVAGTATGTTITASGLLTSSGETAGNGTVSVNATANDGSLIVGEKIITISGQTSVVLVSGITVNGSNITTYGVTSQMSVDILPPNATDKTIVWSLESNTIGATISATGLLTASGACGGDGTVTVKASATDGSSIFGTANIVISNQVSTFAPGTVQDFELNTYNYKQIGCQVWMTENLKSTKYSNGTAIPLVTDNTAWGALGDNNTDKAYCYYNNNASGEKDIYGALYTWAAAMNGASSSSASPSDIQGICPTGWHLPSDAEWTTLTDFLGGWIVAGGKLKEAGTIHWDSPNTGADNSTGFAVLAGGNRGFDHGVALNLGTVADFWSATENDATHVWGRRLHYYSNYVSRAIAPKSYGFSVRCLRDN